MSISVISFDVGENDISMSQFKAATEYCEYLKLHPEDQTLKARYFRRVLGECVLKLQ